MYFQANNLQNPTVGRHFSELVANRTIWDMQNTGMVETYRPVMTTEMLQCNALGGFNNDFWMQVDRQIVRLAQEEVGMDILNDLLGIQRTLPIGKTAQMYMTVGDIAEDVAISIDGQAPYSFDHTEYAGDGDPVPMFTAGFGVNWRLAQGLNTVGIDLVLDSQEAKLRKYNKKVVSYLLDGSDTINVDGKPGQGLRNHRNTYKINLGNGAGGASIDLTTATAVQIIEFFTKGAYAQALRANLIPRLSVLWVSPEIWGNLTQPYLVELGTNGGTVAGTVWDAVKRFVGADDLRQTFALKGNEFLGYVRRNSYLAPLVGMTTGTVPLPRLMPQANYNFQIMGAMGVQVRADSEGHSGVFYGANLD